jgi:hypothetical protein
MINCGQMRRPCRTLRGTLYLMVFHSWPGTGAVGLPPVRAGCGRR